MLPVNGVRDGCLGSMQRSGGHASFPAHSSRVERDKCIEGHPAVKMLLT
jgi:hypothetical protein